MSRETVTVNSRLYDGTVGKSWQCELIEQSDTRITLLGEFDREIDHEHLGVIRRGTVSYEYYWLDKWFNVFRFEEPGGSFMFYYCNLNMPPTFDSGILDYVDLDIDVLVKNEGDITILDTDEFEQNAMRYGYSEELRRKVSAAQDDVLTMIRHRQFPFDS